MNAYQLHRDGDCGFSCPVCEEECDACGNHLHYCTCPTLPIEETP
jgi:hypothetical protein